MLTFLKNLGPVDFDQTRVCILVLLPVIHLVQDDDAGCTWKAERGVRLCGIQLATLPIPLHCCSIAPPQGCYAQAKYMVLSHVLGHKLIPFKDRLLNHTLGRILFTAHLILQLP